MDAPLPWTLRWRLSVLWALEWGITGAILTYLPVYFTEHGLSVEQLGWLMAVSAVGLWVAPFVVGQVCDRWVSAERYLAFAHLVGGTALIGIPWATGRMQSTGEGFWLLLLIVGTYAAAYFPTMPLASSLTFRHLSDRDKQFGGVRIWGTVGWVLAGLILSIWLGQRELGEQLPGLQRSLAELAAGAPPVPAPMPADCFYLGAGLSFALVLFTVFLPRTPPIPAVKGSVAPLETFKMFGDRSFSVLIVVSFLLAIIIPSYSLAVPKLVEGMLHSAGWSNDWVPAVMTVGQISEFPALLLLPLCLSRFGLKGTFALGMLAWIVRYTFFAFEEPAWLILVGISFHGICHVFLVIVIQLFVDAQCRLDVRHSAQNLFAFITMGVAMPVGFVLAGLLGQWCRIDSAEGADYRTFFGVPAAAIALLLAAYWVWFRFDESQRGRTIADPKA